MQVIELKKPICKRQRSYIIYRVFRANYSDKSYFTFFLCWPLSHACGVDHSFQPFPITNRIFGYCTRLVSTLIIYIYFFILPTPLPIYFYSRFAYLLDYLVIISFLKNNFNPFSLVFPAAFVTSKFPLLCINICPLLIFMQLRQIRLYRIDNGRLLTYVCNQMFSLFACAKTTHVGRVVK